MKKQQIPQEATYRVTFEKKPEYNAEYKLTLEKSGSFQYGNQTCLSIFVDGKFLESLDTRYESGIVSDFEKWCDNYMAHRFDRNLKPHIERVIMIKTD